MLSGQILVMDENGNRILKLEDIEELEQYLIELCGNDSEPIEIHFHKKPYTMMDKISIPYRKFIIYQ